MAVADTGKTILLIDGDEDFREPMAMVLAAEGYRVCCAANGDQGIRMAAEQPPDLIILDLMMPEKDGFETSQELSAVPRLRDVPILALTAFSQDIGEIYGAPKNGPPRSIRGYMEKPVEFNVFLERVAAALAAEGSGPI
jgi:two-component system alkaline phosphatase synthesis response regulator PhoP